MGASQSDENNDFSQSYYYSESSETPSDDYIDEEIDSGTPSDDYIDEEIDYNRNRGNSSNDNINKEERNVSRVNTPPASRKLDDIFQVRKEGCNRSGSRVNVQPIENKPSEFKPRNPDVDNNWNGGRVNTQPFEFKPRNPDYTNNNRNGDPVNTQSFRFQPRNPNINNNWNGGQPFEYQPNNPDYINNNRNKT